LCHLKLGGPVGSHDACGWEEQFIHV
jgi:hypothetical protein